MRRVQRLTRSCSRPASRAGSAICATTSPTSSRLMERPRGAATTGGRAATRCTWSQPGQRVSGSCSASRQARRNDEITAFAALRHLDLKGALVTMDAMGTQTEIARAIRDGGGDYCMSLKNWPAVYADVEQLFNDPPDDVVFEPMRRRTSPEGGSNPSAHGLPQGRLDDLGPALPGRTRVPGPGHGRPDRTEVERNGKIEHETRYYLCSLALCALSFARVVRAHWGVENRLHWVLDVIFREDLARFRTGDGPQNMAIIRHTALNLLSRARPTVSLKNRASALAGMTIPRTASARA